MTAGTESAAQPTFDTRGIIEDTVAVLRARGLVFAVAGIPFLFLPEIVLTWLQEVSKGSLPATGLVALVALLVRIATRGLWQAWAALIVVDHFQAGSHRTVLSYIGEVRDRGFAIFGLCLLRTLAVSAASLLLLIPGLILMTRWFAALPILVVEGVGARSALGRSRALTQGRRWAIFGLTMMYSLAVIALVLGSLLVIGGGAGILQGSVSPAWTYLGQPFLVLVAGVVSGPAIAVIYLELIRVDDGSASAATADVFS